MLTEQLANAGVVAETTTFEDDSDFTAFVEAGIASGGVLTGDSQQKGPRQADRWGGQADQVFNRRYHLACDRIENVNPTALDRFTDAIAGTVAHFATRPWSAPGQLVSDQSNRIFPKRNRRDLTAGLVNQRGRSRPRGSRGPARQELAPGRSGPLRSGIDPVGLQDLPHRRRGDRMTESDQLPLETSVAPGAVLPGHPQHQAWMGCATGGRRGCRRG